MRVLDREKRYQDGETEGDMGCARKRRRFGGAELGMRRMGGGDFIVATLRVTATMTSDADFATGLIQSSIEARSVFIVIQHYYL